MGSTLLLRRALLIMLAAIVGLPHPIPATVAADVAGRRVLEVGPGKAFPVPSAAARAARDGDVIAIAAGTYPRDVAVWRAHDLIIRGVGGRAHLQADGAHAEGKAIWVIKGRHTTVEHVEFSGARVRDRNGAGIRQEGPGLTVRHCFFHDNENGILAARHPESDILIEHSEFAGNGHGDGQSHNIYIGAVRRFTLRFSYVHHARMGHHVKSRAAETAILYNRIMDETTGTASYEIDLPNGGRSYIIGNVLQQGRRADNSTLIAYGAEGFRHAVNELYLVNNTLVNDRPPQAQFVFVHTGAGTVRMVNNIFAGSGTPAIGAVVADHNLVSIPAGFADAARFDYRLRAGSPAIDAGTDPGNANGFALLPAHQYVHPLGEEARPVSGAVDLGAWEHPGTE